MRRFPGMAFSLLLIVFLHLLPAAAPAAFGADEPSQTADKPAAPFSAAAASAELKRLQTEQDRIKQQASKDTTGNQLTELDDAVHRLLADVDTLTGTLVAERAKVQAQIDLLGPPPADGSASEAPAVARQRADLNGRATALDEQLKKAEEDKESLGNLADQIGKLQRGHLKDQVALRSNSILSGDFWMPAFDPSPQDRQRFESLRSLVTPMAKQAWDAEHRTGTVMLLALAFAIWSLGRRLIERGMAWVCLHRLPEHRLRRSALALSTALATVLTTALAVRIVLFAFTRDYELSEPMRDLADELIKLTMTSALIAGLGRALLCTRHPTWRLPSLHDDIARALRPFPIVLAGLLLLAGTVEQLNRTIDTSVQVTLFGRGLVSLVVTLTIGAGLLRANRVRAALVAAGERPGSGSTLTGIVLAGLTATIVVTLVALVTGYITFARFLTYEIVWFDIVLCSLYLLTKLTRDACESLFSVHYSSGRIIKQLFGLGDSHLDQVSTVLSGLGSSLLLLLAVIALLTGGFGTTPKDLLDSLLMVLGGERLRAMNIMPERILNAVIATGVGVYILRSVRRWLDADLLPKTGMEPGMRASLVTLFSNIGYVLLVLMTLSLLGVRWDNLAWIVSALSVGIGFGLQEIVKNFISGLILLTERPVKVGDMVNIGGVEGDIRRISVRATEIQLGDRSTMIVPNSQLISQSVRNVTMNNSTLGVASLTLTFPLNIDPEEVRDMLLAAYADNQAILDHPAPSVTFSQLAPNGITLTVTGFVSSPRIAGGTKSDLLFDILKRLRAAEIPLTHPQTLRLVNSEVLAA